MKGTVFYVCTDNPVSCHIITCFPPEILQDFFEGTVPAELSVCRNSYQKDTSLNILNREIKAFPYEDFDGVNKPKTIDKASFNKGSIDGDGHGKWALLCLLPLIIGDGA